MPSPRLTDVAGIAEYLGRTESQIYDLVRRGQIPVVRLDRRLQFDLRRIDAWIEAHTVEAGS